MDVRELVKPEVDPNIARISPGDNVKVRLRMVEGGKERLVLRPTEGPSPRLTQREYRNTMGLIDVWDELADIC